MNQDVVYLDTIDYTYLDTMVVIDTRVTLDEVLGKNEQIEQAPSFDTLIYFKRGACFGECPVYEFLIYDTGNVKYTGHQYAPKIGKYASNLPHTELQKLRQFNSTGLSDYYPEREEPIVDLPMRTFVFKKDGNRKIVRCSYDQPKELIALEQEIENWIINLEFIKVP